MEIALRLKFTQHPKLKKLLLNTGDAELVEVVTIPYLHSIHDCDQGRPSSQDSPRDWFWGVGADRTGDNELGKALMRLRDELREPGYVSRP